MDFLFYIPIISAKQGEEEYLLIIFSLSRGELKRANFRPSAT